MLFRLTRRVLLICPLVALGSCATLPEEAQVKSFGDAASASSTAMQEAVRSVGMIALRTGRERQAEAYVQGRSVFLLSPDPDDPVEIAAITGAAVQLRSLAALDSYGKALVQATEAGSVQQRVQAAQQLGLAAGALVGVALPAAAAVSTPAGGFVGQLVGYSSASAHAANVRSIIRATDSAVQTLAAELPHDLNFIADQVQSEVDAFEFDRQSVLRAIRQDGKVNRATLYQQYVEAREQVEALRASLVAIRNSSSHFERLAEAHRALTTGSPDRSEQVAGFANATTELAELIKAVRTVRGE